MKADTVDKSPRIIEAEALELKPLGQSKEPSPTIDTNDTIDGIEVTEYEVISLVDETPPDPSKTGPKNKKKLVAIEVLGYSVGRGVRKRVVNPDDVYKLAAMGCTDREIARWFDIDENTLRYNFSDVIDKGQMDLKQVLRAAMIKNAVGGNAAVQIFLAKNMLGMSDSPNNSDDKKPLPWNEED